MNTADPIRVLHVTYDMRIGGTEQVIRNLVESTDPKTIEMSIFCIEEPLGPWGVLLERTGIQIDVHARKPGFDLKLVLALRKHILRHNVDIVHCHQYTPWVYGAFAAFGTRACVIFTEHGRFYPDSASPKRRFVNPVLTVFTKRITAISEATKQALGRYEYISPKRIQVVYNGLKPVSVENTASAKIRSSLGIQDTSIVLGSVARFDPIKNHKMMLDAFRIVVDKHPDTKLLLIGDGEERANIETHAREIGLESNLVLPGYISAPSAWLGAIDVFLLSSLSEGTSMTLLEAMSLAKPSVVTNVGGNPEIVINGETGYVTPSGDANQFAKAVLHLIENSAEYDRMGSQAASRFRQNFLNTTMARAYCECYQAVFSKG
ncbi:glycosyltransferase [Congregibacter brevis]|uniref:Glycosyltransferase n=1 Tax=Congregibacter brevis TaxID=3081201 RepID=A0ABZ0IJ26_9GAMM|nr:glycosyltransferase [Congregibacter sp. IMCC45268]